MGFGNWIHNVALNLDRTVASMFGAPQDISISAELERHEHNPIVGPFEHTVNWVACHVFRQPNHCEDADAVESAEQKAIDEYYKTHLDNP